MPHRITRTSFGFSALAALIATGVALPARAATSVTVNGQAVTLNPAPVERAGRVFVPLRGIFEQLGASVVYQAGTINATGNGRNISLHIGSTQASVNGAAQALDVAPFVVGASTYVPLRFVSQALGANVNYDGTNKIVAITTNGGGPVAAAPAPAATVVSDVLRDLQPGRASTVQSVRPTVEANFAQKVDPNSLTLTLDGLDITSASTRSQSGFIYAPPSPLQNTEHRVDVRGKLLSGDPFQGSWRFTSGTEAAHNALNITAPGDGSSVPSTFTVSGRTAPNARVHIVAGATANLGGVFAFGAGNYTGDTVADGNGNFGQEVSLQTVSGAAIGVTVTSTDPVSKESAQAKLTLRAH